jgi:sugar (glycoside-pentoside-hexuronide) transporter
MVLQHRVPDGIKTLLRAPLLTMASSPATLPLKEKLAYGLGDSAANLIFQTQITFLLFFYTDVFGIGAGVAGTILLVSRIIDAFNDPIVGAIADRTNSRWGRYRPWILWTAVPLAVALVLCYTTPPLGAAGKTVWAVATYNLLMILYAANNIPYCALSGVMTADSYQRTSLASWRFVCAMLSALVVNMLTIQLVDFFGRGDRRIGYPATMALWGGVAIILFAITFTFTRERVRPEYKQRSSFRQDLVDLCHCGPWLALFLLAVLLYVQLALRSGTMLYYFDHYRHPERILSWIDNFGLFNGLGLMFTIVGVMLAKPLQTRFGKRRTFRACLVVSAVLMASFALLPPDSVTMLLALQIALQLSFGPTIPILWAMMADVADFLEWNTARRFTALAFATIIFGMKLGLGIGGWLNGALLEMSGYSDTAGIPESARLCIVLMISVLPAVALVVGWAVMWAYPLDDGLMNDIEVELNTRRVALDNTGVP